MRAFRAGLAILATAACLIGATAAQATPYSEFVPVPNPKGIVLMIHGGGWKGGADGVRAQYLQDTAAWFRSLGLDTFNVDYATATTPGHEWDGYNDIHSFFASARYVIGNTRPVCVWGSSAGAQYAARLTEADDVDCALLEGMPSDLVPGHGLPPYSQSAADAAFGSWEAFMSPINFAQNVVVPTAVGTGYDDVYAPLSSQAAPFVARVNQSHPGVAASLWLRSGSCFFTHVSAHCGDVSSWKAGMAWALASAVQQRADGVKGPP
jgi:hypothetical protein